MTAEHILFALNLGKMRQNRELPVYVLTTALPDVVPMVLVFI